MEDFGVLDHTLPEDASIPETRCPERTYRRMTPNRYPSRRYAVYPAPSIYGSLTTNEPGFRQVSVPVQEQFP